MDELFTPEILTRLVVTYPVFLFSLVFHEFAHAWMGLRRGDDLAKHMGRLTLNPLPHIDPVGTVLIPLFLMVSSWGFMFGWARPVPVNPRTSSRDMAIIAAAGPAANLLLVPPFAALAFGLAHTMGADPPAVLLGLHDMALAGVVWNLVLAYFNLLPVPPLDGSRIVYHVLPSGWREAWRTVERYGWVVLLVLLFTPLGAIVFLPLMLVVTLARVVL